MNGDELLRGESLEYRYAGQTLPVFAGINLLIRAGRLTAVVGASGIGKSTLLHVLAGHLTPTAGAVQTDDARGRVALVPQDHRLLPWRSARANVEVPLLAMGLSKNERRRRAQEALNQTQAGDFSEQPVCTLSGGMRSRVVLARALAVHPRVLVLDEPFSGVDWWTRRALHAELASLVLTSRLGAVLVTHDVDEAVHLADEIVVFVGRPATIAAVLAVDISRNLRDDPAAATALTAIRWEALQLMQVGGTSAEGTLAAGCRMDASQHEERR